MRAIVQDKYGSPDVLELRDVEKPQIGDDEVLVRVHAASVNPADWHIMRGDPYLLRVSFGLTKPRVSVRGRDVAGRVEAVGKNVRAFSADDEVFAEVDRGSFAEFTSAGSERLSPKPANLTFEQAAAVPLAANTALQGLREAGKLKAGQNVLINGASGGVGTFAVQIAKSLGAEGTGVCSSRKADLVRSIGADHVIAYDREDFTRGGSRYDLILDVAGKPSLSDFRRALTPDGTVVLVSGSGGPWIGPVGRFVHALGLTPFVRHSLRPLAAVPSSERLRFLTTLIEAGDVTPVVDRTYALSEVPEAIRYLKEGHALGKVVITV